MLRMKVAVNHFKHLLLGDLHVAAVHQETEVFKKLAPRCRDVNIAEKTWKSWFEEPQIIPRLKTIRTLDALASCAIRVVSERDGEEKALPSGFFGQLVHGGLVKRMMQASKSKHPLIALRDRAESYKPISPLHLHLDAIEVDALSEGYGDISWETVKRVGAERILSILAERWGPRHGTAYLEFSSDLSLDWEAADADRRAEIRKGYARFKPDLFENALNQVPHPAWARTGIGADVSSTHIYKALFSLAADTRFLKADRLVTWSLDLATAALAMHALAWSDRYTTFDDLMPDELIYWIAFEEIFFTSEPLDASNTEIVRAISQLDAEWTEETFSIFNRAREIYQCQLAELGLTANEVLGTAMLAVEAHPLRYVMKE
ncbi:hypothetical protein MIZ01_0559 [Sideroxyarcus emersonii]|uniref:Uncharacterized protein n=1 Tax=Sideroxyarcus emersonii TaxID=2764705 RepID=A0AAN1X938_9PROT|nr:hypothetical protein [Sideroxyarcus emersonii]BCK86793.1 hypothetical protein MIZ01_0559 [Sideroxyarcus emersonii]